MQLLIGQGLMDEETEAIKEWVDPNSSETMYPKEWVERGVSDWEFKRCPWWLDYPLNHVPPSEELL